MSKDSLQDLEKKLLLSLKEILVNLYPNGRVQGQEFVLGNVGGDKGSSLKINLISGLWSDFALGASGRILKFFSYRHGNSFPKGMEEVRQLLKLPPNPISNKYKKPKKDWLEDVDFNSRPFRYLLNKRKIPRSVLIDSKVRANDREYIFAGYDEENKLSYVQYTQRTPDGGKKIRFSPKSKLCLWGMHTMRDLSSDGSVVITEGVIDALTFRTADIFAVSIPSGINNKDWIENSWNFLSQFNTIYLAFDYDEAGQEDIREIAGRLGIYRCKKVVIPDKDANQCMVENPETWTQLLKQYLAEATDLAPPKRVTARELRSAVDAAIEAGPLKDQGDLLLGWEFKPTEVKRKPVNFRLRPSEQTIWGGYPGGGKTTLLLQHLSYSMFVLDQKVAIASLEEPATKVVTTILEQALAYFPDTGSKEYQQAFEIINDKLIIFNELGLAPLDEVLEFFEYSSKKDGAAHCVLDSLMCTDVDVDGDKAAVNHMIKKIIQSTNRVGAHYHIVAHCTKGDDEDWSGMPKQKDIKGIQEITARAHNVIMVWRNKVKEGSIEGLIKKNQYNEVERKQREQPDGIIKVCKNRNGKVLGQIPVWYNMDNSRYRPCYEESADRSYLEAINFPPV